MIEDDHLNNATHDDTINNATEDEYLINATDDDTSNNMIAGNITFDTYSLRK